MHNDQKNSTLSSELLNASGLLLKLTWQATKFIVRNAPKAIVTIAHVKREITDAIVDEYQSVQKYRREEELNQKIRALKERK